MKLNPPTNLQIREAERRAWIARQRQDRKAHMDCYQYGTVEMDGPPYGARNRRGEILDCFDAYKEWSND